LKNKRLIIAIDGPSGAGKSTVGRALATQLGYLYIDTGAMYRAVSLKAEEKGIDPWDESALSRLVSSIRIVFDAGNEGVRILCNGEDITEAIRSPRISRLASDISKSQVVREALVGMQKEMGKEKGVVLDGRDIGTVVFPEADVKFYLDADPEERGRRRYRELSERGMEVDFKKTVQEVIERDRNDMNRSLSPLKRAHDAVFIDSTGRSAEEVVEEMYRVIVEKRRWSEIDYR